MKNEWRNTNNKNNTITHRWM